MTDGFEETAEELYEDAPCGYLSTQPDGTITRINRTLLRWLGYDRADLVGQRRFADLLTVGGRIFHETHLAPLLMMQGAIGGIAVDLRTRTGAVLPVLVNGQVRTDAAGRPQLIRITVFDARDRRSYEQELLRARQAAETDRERLRELVRDLQRSLLPPELPAVPGLTAAAHYHAASDSQVGGDFYDLFPLPVGGPRWGLLLGDVCGKGVEAAAITARARYTLRASTAYAADPAAGLRLLNTVLLTEPPAELTRFCTAILGVITPVDGGVSLRLASGGHPPPLRRRADGRVDFPALPAGPLIGGLPDPVFASTTLVLAPGDTLLLYTDGLTEARVDADRTRFGREGLRDLISGLPAGDAADMITAISGRLADLGDGVEDDTALLAITVRQPEGRVR